MSSRSLVPSGLAKIALVFLSGALVAGPLAAPPRRGPARGLDTRPARVDEVGKISRPVLDRAAVSPDGTLELIVTYRNRPGLMETVKMAWLGGQQRRSLALVRGHAVRLPARALGRLARDPSVASVSLDVPVGPNLDVTRASLETDRADGFRLPDGFELTGEGIGVAILDSGAKGHKDLKIKKKVSMIKGKKDDRFGHGNHIAGIIGGNGKKSDNLWRGIAPEATLLSVKVLDDNGIGYTSDVIAGLAWVLENQEKYNIRVANLSLGHPVYEPAQTDPLVQAVERVWDAGIVVVCSAGNRGRDGFLTINSPGNSRKVITVGSVTDQDTSERSDDAISTFSSRGPTFGDLILKPDLVASGNRIVAPSAKDSWLEKHYEHRKVTAPGEKDPEYFSMSGTSMAAAVVSGAIALMLEQDPSLTPATVKARLMASAKKSVSDNLLERGAGALDIIAALEAEGWADEAPSPRLLLTPRDGNEGEARFDIAIEDVSDLWGDIVLWGDTILWGDIVLWGDAILWGDIVLWGDTDISGDTALWGDAAVHGDMYQEHALIPEDD